jgi:hypothetical protein
MSRADVPAVERIIANTINATARGDPDALATRIVAALGEAGYRIVPTNGIETTTPVRNPITAGRSRSTAARTAIPGSLPATPRRAWALSGIKRTRRQAVR